MPQRNGYIPGVPCWVDASQPDPEAAAEFYGALFGWAFRNVLPPDAEESYLVASCETTAWSLFDRSGEARSGNVAALRAAPATTLPAIWNTYFWVDSADEAASRVRDAGGAVVTEP
jgi:uncharacterized protein